MADKRRCEGQVLLGGFYDRGCRNTGRFFEAGKWYCGTHQPSRVKARQKARDQAMHEKWEARQRRWERRDRIRDAEHMLVEAVLMEHPGRLGSKLRRLRQAVIDAREG